MEHDGVTFTAQLSDTPSGPAPEIRVSTDQASALARVNRNGTVDLSPFTDADGVQPSDNDAWCAAVADWLSGLVLP